MLCCITNGSPAALRENRQRSLRSLLRLRLRLETCPNLEALSQRTCELRKASCKHRSALARGGALLDSAEGPMREFPGFSRNGTHHVRSV